MSTQPRFLVHDTAPSPDDVALLPLATEASPGAPLGRVVRVSASRRQASVQLPGGRVVQAYAGRFGWNLADGTRQPVRWGTPRTEGDAPTPACEPVLLGSADADPGFPADPAEQADAPAPTATAVGDLASEPELGDTVDVVFPEDERPGVWDAPWRVVRLVRPLGGSSPVVAWVGLHGVQRRLDRDSAGAWRTARRTRVLWRRTPADALWTPDAPAPGAWPRWHHATPAPDGALWAACGAPLPYGEVDTWPALPSDALPCASCARLVADGADAARAAAEQVAADAAAEVAWAAVAPRPAAPAVRWSPGQAQWHAVTSPDRPGRAVCGVPVSDTAPLLDRVPSRPGAVACGACLDRVGDGGASPQATPELHTPTTLSGPFGLSVACSCGWRTDSQHHRDARRRQAAADRQHADHALAALREAVRVGWAVTR